MTSYYELLRHPLWQEKRLRIMERAGFACEECRGNDITLNVHHGYYEKGKKPWEYPDESLKCLCEDCHKKSERLRREFLGLFVMLPQEQQCEMIGYVAAELARSGIWTGNISGSAAIQGAMNCILASAKGEASCQGPMTQVVFGSDESGDEITIAPMKLKVTIYLAHH